MKTKHRPHRNDELGAFRAAMVCGILIVGAVLALHFFFRTLPGSRILSDVAPAYSRAPAQPPTIR